MTNEAMDYVREDCRRDAMVDRAGKSRRRWPWNVDTDEDGYIEPYDEMEDVRPGQHDDFDNL